MHTSTIMEYTSASAEPALMRIMATFSADHHSQFVHCPIHQELVSIHADNTGHALSCSQTTPVA